MSWIQKLYETYECCFGKHPPGSEPLEPVAHITRQAHIEIVLDDKGNFRRAELLGKKKTFIPATEQSSAGRTRGIAPHPLCDKIQYCAGDYASSGGKKRSNFEDYLEQLTRWCDSDYSHAKAKAVLAYVNKRSVVADLIDSGILEKGKKFKEYLVLKKKSESEGHRKGKIGDKSAYKDSSNLIQDYGDAFIRWRIEQPGNTCTGTWEDYELIEAWKQFERQLRIQKGFCLVTGENDCFLAKLHPAELRYYGDQAKIISSNDKSNFTFRGRFNNADQAAGVTAEVSQKAHHALRWLISRQQAFKNGDQVFVSWAIRGKIIPDPWLSSLQLFGEDDPQNVGQGYDQSFVSQGDVGQAFSLRLNRAIAGYKANLDDNEDVVIMGLDSPSTKTRRLAIVFYRELKGSEFLHRIEGWHTLLAWPQNFGMKLRFIGAPAPRDIAEAAYGRKLDDKLKKSTIERLLPCIIDGQQLPKDLVDSCVRQACNRVGQDEWAWEKCLGIACSLYKGFHMERSFQMALEENRTTRDYLYGRLLAVAEHIEWRALNFAKEERPTSAARLMQRFAERPHSTWRTIELSLTPYKVRLRSARPGFLWKMEKLLDELLSLFSNNDENDSFTNDRQLTGEFLLGYHCQRQKLRSETIETDENDTDENTSN